MEHAREKYEVSERHACRLLGQWRRTQRYAAIQKIDEEALTEAIIALASEYGRYGYRRITALLQRDGWQVGKDRVQRIWRREGLKVPQKQRPRRRLWLNDGSCIRLRPERMNHVWSYDFVSAMTHDGRTLRMLTLIDEYTREASSNMTPDQVKQLVAQHPNLSQEQKDKIMKNLKVVTLAQNRRVDITLSSTGQQSVRQFPFNAEDALTLLSPGTKKKR